MSIKTLSHIGIGVRDIEESVDFYCDVFGMYVLYRHEFREHPENVTDQDKRDRHLVYLAWNDSADPIIVMGESEAIGDDNAPPRLDDLGIHHVAFWVDDLEVFAKRLERRSAKILVPASRKNPHETGGGKRGTSSTMFFEDPSGNILQLDERPKRRG